MRRTLAALFWLLLAGAGAWAYATLTLGRGEPLNSAYLLLAALCTYAIGYRFYSKWIAARVLALEDRRATPCMVHDDGQDFVQTNKWIVFGHHFAAIAGPGPLVGPVLAAQFGYLPGALWILLGVTLGGAVQDFIVLFASLRRDGKSLAQMVKEELNTPAGYLAMVAMVAILVILLAVLALVMVQALAQSPWGVLTVGATIPIALFMGGYLRFIRVGKILEATAIGVGGLLLAVWGGKLVYQSPVLSQAFALAPMSLAWAVILYGLAGSVLPVWLLLAPRDYLSTFMKLGTIFALAAGLFLVLPVLKMPALTSFLDGSGPVVAGKVFPFCFITIACGAISGFHTLIASGTTPKLLTRESYARSVGYGAMCLESLVAIMALVAACTLDPGTYFCMNLKGEPPETVAKVNALHFPASLEQVNQLAAQLGEKSLFNRTGGAATLAVGMAQVFSKVVHGRGLDLWYHFAIMFEALFILTTIDAGTRVGRYLLQDLLGRFAPALAQTRSLKANLLASSLMVGAWGYFLIQGVRDPLGGVNSLWPLFGIANQVLAAMALCLVTTIILKMQLVQGPGAGVQSSQFTVHGSGPGGGGGTEWECRGSSVEGPSSRPSGGGGTKPEIPSCPPTLDPRPSTPDTLHPTLDTRHSTLDTRHSTLDTRHSKGRPALALITLVPLAWLLAVTMTAGVQKIWHPDLRVGFLAQAKALDTKQPALEQAVAAARAGADTARLKAAEKDLRENRVLRFNNRLDAVAAGVFLALTAVIVLLSVREWVWLLARRKLAVLRETPPTWLPDYAVAEGKPLRFLGLLALALALARELSGEAALDRAQQAAQGPAPARAGLDCQGVAARLGTRPADQQRYLEMTENRFKGVRRCC